MSMAESFARTGIARFINSPTGRLVRIVVGLALIGWGYTRPNQTTGAILMAVGLVPLAAGLFNLCIVSALLGGPLSGAKIGNNPGA